MTLTVSDTFSGSGALGVTEVGGLPWVTSGSWSRSGGKAVTGTAASANPHAVVVLGSGDVDITATVGGPGDAVVFRRVDAATWCRARYYSLTTGYSTPYTEYQYTASYANGGITQSTTTWGYPPSSVPFGATTLYLVSATVVGSRTGYYYSTSTTFGVTVERSRLGAITEIGRVSNGTAPVTALRLVARAARIQIGLNGADWQTLTDPSPLAGWGHGIGIGDPASGTSNLTSVSITDLSTAPNSPVLLAPVSLTPVNVGIPNRLSWQFSDDDAGDSQASAEVRWRVTGAPTWTTATVANLPWRDYPAGTWTAGQQIEWTARTTDQSGKTGPWAPSAFFTAAASPVGPTWTSPTAGGTVSNAATVTWSVPDQTAFELRRVGDASDASPDPATVYQTTGTVTDPAARSLPVAFDVNNRWEHLQLRVRATSGLWTDWTDLRVRVFYTPPARPRVTATPDDENALIVVQISNGTAGGSSPVVVGNTVTAMAASEPDRTWTGIPRDGVLVDEVPRHGVDYIFIVTAYGANGTTNTGSSADPTLNPVDAYVDDDFALVDDPFALVGG